MVAAEDEMQPDLESDPSQLTPKEIIECGLEVNRLETIPLDHVLVESALIDESHADDLGRSMAQKRGQITPISVRARFANEEDIAAESRSDWTTQTVVYDVSDGFHRTVGRKRRGEERINATVMYNVSDEELYDLRILAASSVKAVQFPRIAEWITNSYDQTEWAGRGITVTQAFAITSNDRVTSRLGSLSSEELEKLKQWGKEKCSAWGNKSVGSVLNILRLVDATDRSIIRQVRSSSGGKDRTGKITPARLEAVVSRFGGEEYFGAQHGILRYVVEHRLSAQESVVLVHSLTDFILPGVDEQSAYEAAAATRIGVRSNRKRTTVDDPFVEDEREETDAWFNEEPTPADLDNVANEEPTEEEIVALNESASASLAVLERTTPRMASESPIALYRSDTRSETVAPNNTYESGSINTNGMPQRRRRKFERDVDITSQEHTTVDELVERINDLTQALDAARANIGGAGSADWWRTAPYLTSTERRIMRDLSNGESILDIADKYRTTENQIALTIQSAFAKRHIYLD